MKYTRKAARKFWIDNLKGLCLFLIVIGHLGALPKCVGFILRPTDLVYVTSFFFLSGWLFCSDKYSFADFLLRKTRTLLIPYFAISIAVSLLDWNLYLKPIVYIPKAFVGCLMGDGVPKASPLWFVSTLFFANVFLKIGYAINAKSLRTIYFLSLPFVCYLLYSYSVRLPMRIDSAIGASFIMYFAQVIKSHLTDKPACIIICFFLSILLFAYGCFFNLGLLNYNTIHTWMSFPCAIGGCLFLTIIFQKMLNIEITPPIWIAQNGLPILGFHCLLSFYVDILIRKCGLTDSYAISGIKIAFIFSVLYFVVIPLMNRFKPKWWGIN